jgi:DNA modification methylase
MSFSALYPKIGELAFSPDGGEVLECDPLDTPIKGAKNTAAYNAHSYPTKVPPEAIAPFIAHYTQPGATVLDPFAGSGMTGLAAAMLGRRAVLNDLGFGAAHLAWNLCQPCDPRALERAAAQILKEVDQEFATLYSTTGRDGERAVIAWTLHSQIARCPSCGHEGALWDEATDRERGTVAKRWPCPACGQPVDKQHANFVGSRPAWVSATDRSGRFERAPTLGDVSRFDAIASEPLKHWVPRVPLDPTREMYLRSALHLQDVHEVADFYTPRNLRALSVLWERITAWPEERVRQALAFAFTNTAWHGTRMRRYNARGGQRPLTGTLYIPQLSIEVNPGRVFAHKIKQLRRFYETTPMPAGLPSTVIRGSATALPLPDESIDYCFTDPPFGSNIFYADCATVWEAWLGDVTPMDQEAVINKSLKPAAGGKTIERYGDLMGDAFREIARVLKRNAWTTVVFQSSNAEVWAALRTAVEQAGFDLANATYLDKTQHSHKGYKGRSGAEDVASFDVVLNLHKPGARPRRPKPPGGFTDAAAYLGAHLSGLPPLGEDLEADRQRTLPFLHSLLVQAHFNGGLGLEVGHYAIVRRICEQCFTTTDERHWLLPESAANSHGLSGAPA